VPCLLLSFIVFQTKQITVSKLCSINKCTINNTQIGHNILWKVGFNNVICYSIFYGRTSVYIDSHPFNWMSLWGMNSISESLFSICT